MSVISPLALLLTVAAVSFGDDRWLSARDVAGDAVPPAHLLRPADDQSLWLDPSAGRNKQLETLPELRSPGSPCSQNPVGQWDWPSGAVPATDLSDLAPAHRNSPGSDPLFRRLPPPDHPAQVEDPPAPQSPRDSGAGANVPAGSGAPFAVRSYWIPSEDLRDQPGDLAMSGEEFELAFPVHRDTNGLWLALAGVQRLDLDTSAVFSTSGLAVPDRLWDVEVGAMHLRELADGWRAGGMLRVGSPSDRPFGALRDVTLTLLGFLTIPHGQRDAWSFSLFYSPTAQITFPIPGLAYRWRPSSRFQADLGVPFSLEYQLSEVLTLTASYRPLTDVQVLVRRELGERWSVYGGYRTVNEAFLLADRAIDRERTYLFDQRLTLGLQRQLRGRWSLDLAAAYVFDRQIFQAEKFSGSRRGELAIDPGVAGTLQLLWTR